MTYIFKTVTTTIIIYARSSIGQSSQKMHLQVVLGGSYYEIV